MYTKSVQPNTAQCDLWLKSGGYLPPVMRDFHFQKELFRAIEDRVSPHPQATVKSPTWVEAHVYVVEVFLWFMARRGYTLQKTRKDLAFQDLVQDVAVSTKLRNDLMDQAMGLTPLKSAEGS